MHRIPLQYRGTVDCVEHKFVRAARLAAELGPETEQHHAAAAQPNTHHCRPACEVSFLAHRPTAHQQISLGVTCDHVHRRWRGLGDVFVIAFFGFVAVAGSAWVQLGWIPELAWGAALPPGALATAILVVNNIRDRASDARIGKRTLAVVIQEWER